VRAQSISVRIGRVIWHGQGALPTEALAHAISTAIAQRLDAAQAQDANVAEPPPTPAQHAAAEAVASAVVERLGRTQGAST
jgi:hypothetical protein